MTRSYDVTFQRPSGVTFKIRVNGNTRKTAERRARRALRGELGVDARRLVAISTDFVREAKK